VLIELGDIQWVKRHIQLGDVKSHMKMMIEPKTTNPLMQRLLEEYWINADVLLRQNNLDKLALAVQTDKVIYSSRPLASCAVVHKRLAFVHHMQSTRMVPARVLLF